MKPIKDLPKPKKGDEWLMFDTGFDTWRMLEYNNKKWYELGEFAHPISNFSHFCPIPPKPNKVKTPKKSRTKKQKTIKASLLSAIRMVAGGEKKHPRVILNGRLNNWVGFGWVDEGNATKADKLQYPKVVFD